MNFAIDNGPRRLEAKFTRKGVEYEKIEEGPAFFIYSAKMQDSPRKWFEVFQRRIHDAREIAGQKIEASEAWPPDSAFGSWAWTFDGLNGARGMAGTIKPHKSIAHSGEEA